MTRAEKANNGGALTGSGCGCSSRTAATQPVKTAKTVSRGELEADLSAVAAPIRAGSPEAQSALALVTSSERFELLNVDVLSKLVVNGAGEIGAILTAT